MIIRGQNNVKKTEKLGMILLAVCYFFLIMLTKMFCINNNESLNLFVLGNWKDNNTGQLVSVTKDVDHLKIECNHRVVAENLDIVFVSKDKCIFKDLKNNKYEFKKKGGDDTVDYCIVSEHASESECSSITLTKFRKKLTNSHR